MANPIQEHVDLAKQLLAQKSVGSGTAEEFALAAGEVYVALLRALSPIIGTAGVLALFARSVKVAQVKFPSLSEIPVTTEIPESNVEVEQQALVNCLRSVDPATASDVAVGLLATFLGLMTNFIGERLVWQIVKSAFPEIVEIRPREIS